jgi:hypothetical protein
MTRTTLAALLLSLAATGAHASTTLTFQQGLAGYLGTQDTMIRSNETASPGDSRNTNYGAELFVSVDGDDGSPGLKPNHGLVRFDALFGMAAGQIQPGDTIDSAVLRLSVFNPGSGMTVHNMLASWQQGTVTWNSAVNGIQTDGIEAQATPLATFGADNASENVPIGLLSIDVTASLRAVQAGTLPGFGWALIPFTNGTNGIDFHSSEALDTSVRPLLTVQVTPIPEPGTYALMALGLLSLGLYIRNRRRS